MKTISETLVVIIISLLMVGTAMIIMNGCARKGHMPARSEWLSITKPPVQVIYISQTKITPTQIRNMLTQTNLVPYRNYKFNDVTSVSMSAATDQTHHQSTSNTDATSVSISSGK